MNKSARGRSVDRFGQSQRLDTALYKIAYLPFVVGFIEATRIIMRTFQRSQHRLDKNDAIKSSLQLGAIMLITYFNHELTFNYN